MNQWRQRRFHIFVAVVVAMACLEVVLRILDQFPDWVAERACDAAVVAGITLAALLFVRWMRRWRRTPSPR